MLQGNFFVEQVVVGLLVMLAVLLPYPELTASLLQDSTVFTFGAVLAAYALGAVFDRISDTIMEGFEDWRPASSGSSSNAKASESDAERRRLVDLLHKEGLATRVEYMKTRIRLTRSVAVFAPAVGLSAVLRAANPGPTQFALHVASAVTYSIVLIAAGCTTSKGRSGARAFALAGWLAMTALTGFAAWSSEERSASIGLLGLSAALTALAGWAWWRIRVSLSQLLDPSRGVDEVPSSSGQV